MRRAIAFSLCMAAAATKGRPFDAQTAFAKNEQQQILDALEETFEQDASFVSEGQYFPIAVSELHGVQLVRVCKVDKQLSEEDISKRPFEGAGSSDCKMVTLTDLRAHVEASCPDPAVSFIHHLPHSGSTLLASMLESAPGVRAWSEFKLSNKLGEVENPETSRILARALACSPAASEPVEHVVMKLSSMASFQNIENLRATFPDSAWMFLYREPAQVLAGLCKKELAGEGPCVVAGRPVHVGQAGVALDMLYDLGTKSILSSAVDSRARSGLAIDYVNLLESIPNVLAHFGIDVSPEQLDRIMEVADYDPKESRRKGANAAYDASREAQKDLAIRQHPVLSKVAELLRKAYDKLASAKPVIVEQPETFPIGDIFRFWAPRDSAVPEDADRHNTLQVFDSLSSPRITEYQANEVPFVVRSGKGLTGEKWSPKFLSANVKALKQNKSPTRQHMHYFPKDFKNSRKQPPVKTTSVRYDDFIANVATETEAKAGATLYGILHKEQAPFMGMLDGLKAKMAWDKSHTTDWQCKLGMPGILNEAHFDRSRNVVAMISGTKRWVIAPPKYVGQAGLDTEGPFYRHASFDWSDEANWDKLKGVEVIDVVLREGDVMYLPIGWLHYVLSTDEVAEDGINVQCNSWVGKHSVSEGVIDETGFPTMREDKVRCQQIMENCAFVDEMCLKGKCPPLHYVHACYSLQMKAAREEHPGFQCDAAQSQMAYYGAVCYKSGGKYKESTCPPMDESLKDKMLEFAFRDSSHRRRLAATIDGCDAEQPRRNATLEGPDGSVELSGSFANWTSETLPLCYNMDFSDVFTDWTSYRGYNVSSYACELNDNLELNGRECNELIWWNDLSAVGLHGISISFRTMTDESDNTGLDSNLGAHEVNESLIEGMKAGNWSEWRKTWDGKASERDEWFFGMDFNMDYDGDDFVFWMNIPNAENLGRHWWESGHAPNTSALNFTGDEDHYARPLVNPMMYNASRWIAMLDANKTEWSYTETWPQFGYNTDKEVFSIDMDYDMDEFQRWEWQIYNNVPDSHYQPTINSDRSRPSFAANNQDARQKVDWEDGEKAFVGGESYVFPFLLPQSTKAGGSIWSFELDNWDSNNEPYVINLTAVRAFPTGSPTTIAPTGSPTTTSRLSAECVSSFTTDLTDNSTLVALGDGCVTAFNTFLEDRTVPECDCLRKLPSHFNNTVLVCNNTADIEVMNGHLAPCPDVDNKAVFIGPTLLLLALMLS